MLLEQALDDRHVCGSAEGGSGRRMVADPLPRNGGLFLQRVQAIEGAASFFGQVVDAPAPSATANDVGVSHGHQTALDKVVQRHVEGGTHEAQTLSLIHI